MRRIVVVGSPNWTDRRATMAALRRVTTTYQGPYTLVCDMTDGAARYAAAAARSLGWEVEAHEVDVTKCTADCPPPLGHRRRGGPVGDFCPSAKGHNFRLMFEGEPDLCLVLVRPGRFAKYPPKVGQSVARAKGIAVWTYTQKASGGESDGDQAS